MNAVESAQSLDWKNSSAFNRSLFIDVDPMNVYKFNGLTVMDESFRSKLRVAPKQAFLDCGLPDLSGEFQDAMITDLTLSDDETQTIRELSRLNAMYGRAAGTAIDNAAAAEGYGMPAIAALVLVVVVAVGVFVFVVSVP